MHEAMLGVVKSLLKSWFARKHKKNSVYDKLTLLDECLADIKPTVEITRPP